MSISHATSFPSEHVFLKLEQPEVMDKDEPDPPEEKNIEWMKYWLFRTSDLRFIPDPRLVDYVAEYKRCMRNDTTPWRNVKDFLDILFPIRYWSEGTIRYKQKVSMEQVTRDELKAISDKLDHQLEYRQSQTNARYCPIRFCLHMELLDELIRQVALDDTMRAFMLERVRGELNQTLDAYKKVLEMSLVEEGKVSVSHKIDPELLLLEQKMEIAQRELAVAKEENENAASDLKELENKFELLERIQQKVHEPGIDFSAKINEQLERQIYFFENPPMFENTEEE